MPPIIVPFSRKSITTQILVITKLNGKKYLVLRGCVYIIFPSKQFKKLPSEKLPVQSQQLKHNSKS